MLKAVLATLALSMAHITAHAQAAAPDFPQKQVRFLVPYTPGGNADLIVRILAQKLGESWRSPVVVENRPGASGTIAVNAVARAEPDGHTMVLGAAGNLVVAHKLIKDLPYDVNKDLRPVSVIAAPPFVLVTGADSQFKSVQDVLDHARANPGRVTFGSAGVGSANHLSGELLSSMTGVELMHVAYKGMGPAVNDVMGGRVDLAFAPIPIVMPQVLAGKLRALAVTGLERSKVMSDVPTVDESGVKGFESGAWFAVMVPGATPDAIVERLHRDIKAVTQDASFIEKLESEGAAPIGSAPAESQESLQKEMAKWGKLIDHLGLNPG